MTLNNNDRILRTSARSEEIEDYLIRSGHWDHDIITGIVSWSEEIYNILQVPMAIKPDTQLLFNCYHEPYLGMMGAAVADAYQSGTAWNLELELITARGNVIWVRSAGNAVIENDVVIRLKGTLTDIDTYRTNDTAHNLLKQRHKQLSSFAYILTHNLRNYAGNIAMLTDLAEPDKLDAYHADLLDKISAVSRNLSATIEQMADIMKANENMMESELLSFEEATGNVLDVLRAELELNEAMVETDFIVPSVIFPKLYLDSILMNMISNSIKYRKETEKPEIFISTYENEDNTSVIMEYQDNGIGIDLERYGDKIFGLFKTFTNRPGAHGVGLFLVKTQIESQGGYIIVESKPAVGTIFRVFFKPYSQDKMNFNNNPATNQDSSSKS